MSRKLLWVTGAAVAATAATSITAAEAANSAPARAARLKPVIIQETFTPVRCSGDAGHRTTQQMEGCAEKQILKTDIQIDLLEAAIFPVLPDDRARRDFNAAQRAWLSYRKADCLSLSQLFEGGTATGVLDARCVVSRNTRRVKDLRSFHPIMFSTP